MKLILLILAAIILLFIAPTLILSSFIFRGVLIRTSPDIWGRTVSEPSDKQLVRMYDIGAKWATENSGFLKPLTITNDGFRLAADYYDFGCSRAVIIIPGRTETSVYSRFYAEPYKAAGFNVLLIDNRSHGLSDGRYNSLGYKEYRDLIAWAKLLHEEHANEQIVLHGICVGASSALFALTAKNCPAYLVGMTADGMYKNFYETFKNHMIEKKRPTFPLLYGVMAHIFFILGANVVTDGPYKRIGQLDKRILFLHSKEDIYSVPELTQRLYDACTCDKQIVWFDKGAHSRLRINDAARYDGAIAAFWQA